MSEFYLYIYIYIYATASLSIHLSMDTGCFHILAIVNNTTVNISVHMSFQISVFIFLGNIPRGGIAGSYGLSKWLR